jgi:sugar phosphate permease
MIKEKPSLYYGWIVLAVSFFTMLVAYSLRYNFSVFYVAILKHFGWSRGATAAGFSINLIVYALSCPIAGNLVDRFGVRRIVPAGALILGVILVGFSRMNAIWQFYAIIGVSAFGTCAIGYVTHAPLIANWFLNRRGMALGILSAGITSSAIIAPGVQYLISTLGWKGAFIALAMVSAGVLAPLSAIFQRQHPGDNGPAGKEIEAEDSPARNAAHRNELVVDRDWASRDWTLPTAIKTQRYWYVFLTCLFLGFYCYTILAHQFAYMMDAGFSGAYASRIVALFCIFATVSCFCAFLSDYMGRELTFTFGSVCSLIGLTALFFARSSHHPLIPYLYGIVFGFGYGLCTSMMVVIAADIFQGENFGAINGSFMSSFVLGGAIGPWFAGYIFDVTGSYARAFPLMYFSVLASIVFAWLSSPMRVRTVRGNIPKINRYSG